MGTRGELRVSDSNGNQRTSDIRLTIRGSGAKDVVDEYFQSIGGKPKFSAASNKRSRPSTSATPAASKKKSKTTPSNDSPVPAEEPKWKPPAGSWEDDIAAIDTIEKTEKGLICYIQW